MSKMYSLKHEAFRKGWEFVKSVQVAGDGIQAPGAVVMCIDASDPYPFRIHFFNAQDGGFHDGSYCQTQAQAEEAYAKRVLRFARV